MNYIISMVILACGYYTLTYGKHLYTKEKNKLGGIGAIMYALVGTITPIIVLFIKS